MATPTSPHALRAAVAGFLLLAAELAAQPSLPRDRMQQVPGSLRGFVERLYSADPGERAEAACQIGRRHTEAAAAIPVLLAMLGDDVTVPYIECEMGSWMRRTVPASAEARKWMETSPAKEAAEALGDIGNAAVPGLLQALGDSNWTIRKFAAIGLGEVDRFSDVAPVIGALAERLRDGHPEVRDRSAWALGEIEDPTAVDPLLDALKDSDSRVRERAVWALGEIESERAIDGLLPLLSDADGKVRRQVAWALGEIESARAVPDLTRALGDGDVDVRRRVVWALGEIGSPSAVPALLQTLTDNDAEVRQRSAWALGEIEDGGAVAGLTQALRDDDWRVRKTAAWALGEIEDPSALDSLRAVASDPNAEVRQAVAHAIRELRDRRDR